MFKVIEQETSLLINISSEHHLIERLIVTVQPFMKQFGYENISNIEVVIRELLKNAIEHGNKNNPKKHVKCTISRQDDDLFIITTEDQGLGFNYNQIDYSVHEKIHGYAKINAFSEKLQFKQGGRLVIAYIKVEKETNFKVFDADNRKVIVPTGDITYKVSDVLRKLLNGLLANRYTKYRFDLKHVNSIDAICLNIFVSLAAHVAHIPDKTVLEVINCNNDVLTLFRMTRLDELYQFIE